MATPFLNVLTETVFSHPEHPLNQILAQRFGSVLGGIVNYNPTKADIRRQLTIIFSQSSPDPQGQAEGG